MPTTSEQRKRRAEQAKTVGKAKRAETRYARQLLKIARHVGDIIKAFPPLDPAALAPLRVAMENYSLALQPWASAVAARMLESVSERDESTWFKHAAQISGALKKEIREAPTGVLMRALLAEQVTLIRSLPTEAAQRVHDLTLEAIGNSTRSSEIAKEILRSGEVTESRAKLIARTETARTASKLTEARAVHIGSEGYIWRTALDSKVRKSHKEMEGKFCRWDAPPTLSDGTTTHAGQIYNCRCFAEVVLPEFND